MAKIVEYRDIPMTDLVIGRGQVRTDNTGAEIDELAASIDCQGLLQPIVVCEAQTTGKWEILTGQRRFLAHKVLKRKSISAAILDSRVGESEAKTISITENLVRRNLSGKELKDGILHLYNTYGSIQDVVDATGLPYEKVRINVKYPRLLPELKKLVDDESIDVNVALHAQDASEDAYGTPNAKDAVELALEMQTMSNVQQKKIVKTRKSNPDEPISDVIENARTGARVIQIVVTVGQDTHRAIRNYAEEEKVNQDEAAAGLIEEALTERGFLSR